MHLIYTTTAVSNLSFYALHVQPYYILCKQCLSTNVYATQTLNVYYVVYQTQPSPVISMPQVVDADYCYVRALVENLFERLVNLVAELSSLI